MLPILTDLNYFRVKLRAESILNICFRFWFKKRNFAIDTIARIRSLGPRQFRYTVPVPDYPYTVQYVCLILIQHNFLKLIIVKDWKIYLKLSFL